MLSLQTMNPNIPRSSNPGDIQTAKKLTEMKTIDEPKVASLKRGTSSHKRVSSNFLPTSNDLEITPTPKDVLLGRGGLTNRHKGNAYFRRMVEAEKQKYKSLGGQKKKKSEYSRSIMGRVFAYGGRFLKKDDFSGKWVEADQSTIRKKCSQALRERPLRATKNYNTNSKNVRKA